MVAFSCASEFQSGSSAGPFDRGLMAADKNDACAFVAVGERNAERSSGGMSSGDARHNFKCDFCGVERAQLFVEAAENAGIAALQPHDLLAFAGGIDHERIDFRLRDFFYAAALADVDDDGARSGGERKNARR